MFQHKGRVGMHILLYNTSNTNLCLDKNINQTLFHTQDSDKTYQIHIPSIYMIYIYMIYIHHIYNIYI